MYRSLLSYITLVSAVINPVLAAWGISDSGGSLVVDTGAGLVFTVQKANCDVTSMVFNGIQAQDQSKATHIGSGLGSATVSYTTIGNYIKITCATSTLTQYLVSQRNYAGIHLGTFTTAEPAIGELRYIARLNRNAVPNGPTPSNTYGASSAIEGSDVYVVNGQTRSKFYSSKRFIEDHVHGVSGNGIAVNMIIPGVGTRDYGYETSAGGPFFRDIDNQGSGQQELYFYMNSGHTQTETYRQGFHGPYILAFTTGGTPSADVNMDFWDGLGARGYVSYGNRGTVTGTVSNIPSGYNSLMTVGFKNSAAQYWVTADSSGKFTSPRMKPGTYTMTLFKRELEVATKSVSVSSGGTVTSNIASTESFPNTIWKIGDYDGTPRGFLNADRIETMHPSDSRMRGWARSYSVSQSQDNFPMAIFKDPGGVSITFTLSSSQIGQRTLRIATTLAFGGARPVPTIGRWTGATPAAPNQPDSRGVTRGTWRGNNQNYLWTIPAGTLVAGTNTLTINVVSGSSGDKFLSPSVVFDALSLY